MKTITKVLFLDIDGVLNSADYLNQWPGVFDLPAKDKHLDPEAIARLNRLVAAVKPWVVVTSTWRLTMNPLEIQAWMEKAGYTGQVHEATSDLSQVRVDSLLTRAREIDAWMARHPRVKAEDIVVLDDTPSMMHWSTRLVSTRFKEGLRDVHVDRALSLWNAVKSGG